VKHNQQHVLTKQVWGRAPFIQYSSSQHRVYSCHRHVVIFLRDGLPHLSRTEPMKRGAAGEVRGAGGGAGGEVRSARWSSAPNARPLQRRASLHNALDRNIRVAACMLRRPASADRVARSARSACRSTQGIPVDSHRRLWRLARQDPQGATAGSWGGDQGARVRAGCMK
jgi:hypothetical protein